jgi:hypothetical protein
VADPAIRLRRLVLDELDDRLEARRRVEQADPSVAQPSGAARRGIGPPADREGDGGRWRRRHTAVAGDRGSWTFSRGAPKATVAAIVAYSGVDPTTPVDVNGTATASNATSHPAPRVVGQSREQIRQP